MTRERLNKLRAVNNPLHTLVNLHRWGRGGSPMCKICGPMETMMAPTQGRYVWSHDRSRREPGNINSREKDGSSFQMSSRLSPVFHWRREDHPSGADWAAGCEEASERESERYKDLVQGQSLGGG
ncbi:unnamed protein product [Pleuronectes platessa]|uniref:Uncharacterized protein n=1 Tax=Pleuronectes platessa TaxID=8262 RepID=A0A9N7VMH1_PLEPL|nr:unnamed protein product [Pleuronectes platessa]